MRAHGQAQEARSDWALGYDEETDKPKARDIKAVLLRESASKYAA